MVRTNPRPVETAADLPKHCQACGRTLQFEEVTVGFRPSDGAPILRARAFCRGSWLERLLTDVEGWHDNFIVSPRPAPSLPPPPMRPIR